MAGKKRSFRDVIESGVDGQPLGQMPSPESARKAKSRASKRAVMMDMPEDPTGVFLQKIGIGVHAAAFLAAVLLPWAGIDVPADIRWSLFDLLAAGGLGGLAMAGFFVAVPLAAGAAFQMADMPRASLAAPACMILAVLYANSLSGGIFGLSHKFGFYAYLVLIAAAVALAFRKRSNRIVRLKPLKRY